jgi:hypothetical protein
LLTFVIIITGRLRISTELLITSLIAYIRSCSWKRFVRTSVNHDKIILPFINIKLQFLEMAREKNAQAQGSVADCSHVALPSCDEDGNDFKQPATIGTPPSVAIMQAIKDNDQP